MTRRRCHIAALFSALAQAVAWAAGLIALAAVALGEAA